jgi:hypothetical protein
MRSTARKETAMGEENADVLSMTYKGYTITISPREDRCSRFAVAVADPAGVEFKHAPQAGKDEERAFEYGQRIVDWELEYARQKQEEAERRRVKSDL